MLLFQLFFFAFLVKESCLLMWQLLCIFISLHLLCEVKFQWKLVPDLDFCPGTDFYCPPFNSPCFRKNRKIRIFLCVILRCIRNFPYLICFRFEPRKCLETIRLYGLFCFDRLCLFLLHSLFCYFLCGFLCSTRFQQLQFMYQSVGCICVKA